MANQCYNEVYFTGEQNRVKQANRFLSGHQLDEYDGTAIKGTDGYFQDLYFCNGKFHFGTRWVPDFTTLIAVADLFKVGFIVEYSDPAMSLYGRGMYKDGTFVDVRLDIDDYKKIGYNQKEGTYQYQDRTYRDLEKPALAVLKDKVSQHPACKVRRLKIKRGQ
ncbi:hypothetical protein D0C36_16265 [Mucilaginibacter conchicola]|uniref:YubB ferredoxin-like domain-containing protein n=1 Tax=Mucilaginibacter conchicola TaxID=2303333 RepID=A0A372NV17_9SPHI|nr:hypothetical protein [Mucilaginibacter conchicola]RFZ92942.1 hypothetical protein D0C36_16265 [Mucilaginibacter conchicola]